MIPIRGAVWSITSYAADACTGLPVPSFAVTVSVRWPRALAGRPAPLLTVRPPRSPVQVTSLPSQVNWRRAATHLNLFQVRRTAIVTDGAAEDTAA